MSHYHNGVDGIVQVASLGARLETFDILGCLAMLELGNGSSIADIQTMVRLFRNQVLIGVASLAAKD